MGFRSLRRLTACAALAATLFAQLAAAAQSCAPFDTAPTQVPAVHTRAARAAPPCVHARKAADVRRTADCLQHCEASALAIEHRVDQRLAASSAGLVAMPPPARLSIAPDVPAPALPARHLVAGAARPLYRLHCVSLT